MTPSLNRRIWFDVADFEPKHPGPGDYLVTRHKTGHWGTAYLILKSRKVKRRNSITTERGWRRYALTVQRQAVITPEILRAAGWFMRWRHQHKTVPKPELIQEAARA